MDKWVSESKRLNGLAPNTRPKLIFRKGEQYLASPPCCCDKLSKRCLQNQAWALQHFHKHPSSPLCYSSWSASPLQLNSFPCGDLSSIPWFLLETWSPVWRSVLVSGPLFRGQVSDLGEFSPNLVSASNLRIFFIYFLFIFFYQDLATTVRAIYNWKESCVFHKPLDVFLAAHQH